MKTVLRVLLISTIHWILTLVCRLGEFQSNRLFFFEKPESSHPVWSILLRIFETPLLMIYRTVDPQRMKYYLPVMILNSLFWGIVINVVIILVKKSRQKKFVTTHSKDI